MKERSKGFAAVILSAVCFGLVPLLVQTVNAGGSNTYTTAFYRFVLSLPPLYLYLRWKKIPMGLTRPQVKKILLITVVGYGGTAVLLFNAYNFIPSGMATTIHFVYPVFVILGSMIFLRQRVKPIKLLCVALCFGGILLFYQGGGGAVQPVGLLIAFLSGMTYAFYIIYLDQSGLSEIPSLKLIFYMNALASVMLLAFSLGTGQFTVHLTAVAWLAAVLLAVGVTFIGVQMFQIGVRLVGPQNAAILSTFEPITSLVVGAVVYQESFRMSGVLGCILILTSAVLVARAKE